MPPPFHAPNRSPECSQCNPPLFHHTTSQSWRRVCLLHALWAQHPGSPYVETKHTPGPDLHDDRMPRNLRKMNLLSIVLSPMMSTAFCERRLTARLSSA